MEPLFENSEHDHQSSSRIDHHLNGLRRDSSLDEKAVFLRDKKLKNTLIISKLLDLNQHSTTLNKKQKKSCFMTYYLTMLEA